MRLFKRYFIIILLLLNKYFIIAMNQPPPKLGDEEEATQSSWNPFNKDDEKNVNNLFAKIKIDEEYTPLEIQNEDLEKTNSDKSEKIFIAEDELEVIQWAMVAQQEKEQNQKEESSTARNNITQQLSRTLDPNKQLNNNVGLKWRSIYINELLMSRYNKIKKRTLKLLLLGIVILYYCLDEKVTATKICTAINKNSLNLESFNYIKTVLNSKKHTQFQFQNQVRNLLTKIRYKYNK